MKCKYSSLARECPWAEHLTSLTKGGWVLFQVLPRTMSSLSMILHSYINSQSAVPGEAQMHNLVECIGTPTFSYTGSLQTALMCKWDTDTAVWQKSVHGQSTLGRGWALFRVLPLSPTLEVCKLHWCTSEIQIQQRVTYLNFSYWQLLESPNSHNKSILRDFAMHPNILVMQNTLRSQCNRISDSQ